MNENRAKQASKKTAKAYIVLTAAFVIIFGGITLLGVFIAHLASWVKFLLQPRSKNKLQTEDRYWEPVHLLNNLKPQPKREIRLS